MKIVCSARSADQRLKGSNPVERVNRGEVVSALGTNTWALGEYGTVQSDGLVREITTIPNYPLSIVVRGVSTQEGTCGLWDCTTERCGQLERCGM